MYIAIDIGGTKTLIASIDNDGVITEKTRFETPKNYDEFLDATVKSLRKLKEKEFAAGGVGISATYLDRHHGRALKLGNLPWENVPIQADIERLTDCPIVVENDAKMAGLSEAMLVKDQYDRVLYITVSTGIGIAFIEDRKIETSFGDAGGRTFLVEHKGRLTPWEDFASGRAIVERYGKMAKDIDDAKIWRSVARDLAKGMIELVALVQPEVIVIGGSVGTHYHKYQNYLLEELKKFETPMLTIPTIKAAGRPEEAVLFGCYDLAKATMKARHAHTR